MLGFRTVRGWFGHRIVAAGMQRVAAAKPAHGHPAALEGAIAPDRGHRVFRTAGHEPAAGSKKGADQPFVQAQQGDEETVDHGPETA